MNTSSAIPFAAFVEPARARPQVWRLLVGLLITVIVMALFVALLIAVFRVFAQPVARAHWIDALINGQDANSTLFNLFAITGMGLGAAVAARLLHRRPTGS